MAINIFEGARRIAKVIAVIGVIAGCAAIYLQTPSVEVTYGIAKFGDYPTRIEKCGTNDAAHGRSLTTTSGEDFRVAFCFSPMLASNGEMMIPYKKGDGDNVWLGEKYSGEVIQYTKEIGNAFKVPQEDFALAEKLIFRKKWTDAFTGIGSIALGLGVFWLFIVLTGWIVRGFAGIPNGKDHRTTPISG